MRLELRAHNAEVCFLRGTSRRQGPCPAGPRDSSWPEKCSGSQPALAWMLLSWERKRAERGRPGGWSAQVGWRMGTLQRPVCVGGLAQRPDEGGEAERSSKLLASPFSQFLTEVDLWGSQGAGPSPNSIIWPPGPPLGLRAQPRQFQSPLHPQTFARAHSPGLVTMEWTAPVPRDSAGGDAPAAASPREGTRHAQLGGRRGSLAAPGRTAHGASRPPPRGFSSRLRVRHRGGGRAKKRRVTAG